MQNRLGQRLSLNADKGVYLSVPEGLGFSLSPAYADLKNGFFLPISADSEPQNAFAGTLTFFGSEPYLQWQEFVNWCAFGSPLTLIYAPTSAQEFFRRVDISYLSKGEKNEVGALDVPASFLCLTPWFRPEPSQLSLENMEGNAIRYSYRYKDGLIYGADSSASLSGSIYPAGHIPGGLLLRYTGAILNPRVRLVGTSGKTYGLASVYAELSAGDTFELSTVPNDSHVYRISPDGTVTNLEDFLSLASEPYFRIPVDESCTISVEADAVFDGAAELQIFYYFRSV